MRPANIAFTNGLPARASVLSIEQIPYHWHDALEILLVLKGSAWVELGNDQVKLQEHDLAVLNMGELHRLFGGDAENRVLVLQIDPAFCFSLLPPDRYLFLWCCSAYHAEDQGRYEELRRRLARLVTALPETGSSEAFANLPEVRHVLTSMLKFLFREFDFLRWGIGSAPLDDRRVERLQRMALEASRDLENSPGLKELAASASVSLQHLSNDIKDKFGQTFQELLFYSKCEQAAKLLLATDHRIVDILLECGFSDPKYLIKHFRRNFRCTPSEFRQQFQASQEDLLSQVHTCDRPFTSAREYFALLKLR